MKTPLLGREDSSWHSAGYRAPAPASKSDRSSDSSPNRTSLPPDSLYSRHRAVFDHRLSRRMTARMRSPQLQRAKRVQHGWVFVLTWSSPLIRDSLGAASAY